MKKNVLIQLPIVIGIIVLILASNSLVLGSRGSSTECGISGCHDDNTTIELTSNATGTVEAIQGINFTIRFTSAANSDALRILAGWENNNQFLIFNADVDDNGDGDLDTADKAIIADITFIPIAAGTFTIRAWVAATGGIAETIDITVNVAENTDFTTPTTTADEFDPIATWEFMMMTIIPLTGVVMILLAFIILRKFKGVD